jgi:hypothetical protein
MRQLVGRQCDHSSRTPLGSRATSSGGVIGERWALTGTTGINGAGIAADRCTETASQRLTLMFANPFAQEIGIDAVHQCQFRHRNAGLQTGLDQFALGLRVVAASPILLAA